MRNGLSVSGAAVASTDDRETAGAAQVTGELLIERYVPVWFISGSTSGFGRAPRWEDLARATAFDA